MEDKNLRVQELIRKAKRQSIFFLVLVIAALLLASWFAYRNLETNKALEERNEQVSRQNEELEQKQQELETRNEELLFLNARFDTLQGKYDSLVAITGQFRNGTLTCDGLRKALGPLGESIKQLKNTVFLQDHTKKQRTLSKEFQGLLRQNGYEVASIEQINYAFPTSVKYFHREDEARAREIYELLTDLFRERGLDTSAIKLTPLFHLRSPAGQIEVWINP